MATIKGIFRFLSPRLVFSMGFLLAKNLDLSQFFFWILQTRVAKKNRWCQRAAKQSVTRAQTREQAVKVKK